MRRRGPSVLHQHLLVLGAVAALGCGSSAPKWYTLADGPHDSGPHVCAPGEATAVCSDRSAEGRSTRAPGAAALLRVRARIAVLGVDGADLLFVADEHVFRMPAGGGAAVRIGPNTGDRCLTPALIDSGAVLCHGSRGEEQHLFRIPKDGRPTRARSYGGDAVWTGSGVMARVGGLLLVVLTRPGAGSAEFAIARVPMAGGQHTLVAGWGEASPNVLAADGSHVYHASPPADSLVRRSLAGGPAEPLGASAQAVALSESHVYFASSRGIERIAKGSTTLELLLEVRGSGWGWKPIRALTVDGEHLFWIERRQEALNRVQHLLHRMRADGSEPPAVIAATGWEIPAFAVDAERVYWVEQETIGRDATIFAAPKTASTRTQAVAE